MTVMRKGKWVHIVAALMAAALIILLQLRKEQPEPVERSAMVPLAAIETPGPRFSIPEPIPADAPAARRRAVRDDRRVVTAAEKRRESGTSPAAVAGEKRPGRSSEAHRLASEPALSETIAAALPAATVLPESTQAAGAPGDSLDKQAEQERMLQSIMAAQAAQDSSAGDADALSSDEQMAALLEIAKAVEEREQAAGGPPPRNPSPAFTGAAKTKAQVETPPGLSAEKRSLPERKVEAEKPPAPALVKRPVRKMTPQEERIHNDMVKLIRNYVEENPLPPPVNQGYANLTSSSNLAQIGVSGKAALRPSPGRWSIGVGAGPHWLLPRVQGLPAMGMQYDFYAGRPVTRWMQMGVAAGWVTSRMPEAYASVPATLLHGELQLRLFARPAARFSPLLILGAGLAQRYHTTMAASPEVARSSGVAALVGAGAEYRLGERVGVQAFVACRYLGNGPDASAGGGEGNLSMTIRGGITFKLGGRAEESGGSGGGLVTLQQ